MMGAATVAAVDGAAVMVARDGEYVLPVLRHDRRRPVVEAVGVAGPVPDLEPRPADVDRHVANELAQPG